MSHICFILKYFYYASYSGSFSTLLFILIIWAWKNTICLTSFGFLDVQSVKRFVRRLITKWYDHYSSHHLIYNVNWIASLECTVSQINRFTKSLKESFKHSLKRRKNISLLYNGLCSYFIHFIIILFTSVNTSPYKNSFRVLWLH